MSLGTLLAAAPALAEAGETALSSPPPFEYATPSVPPQAVDSAVDQIIAAVKVMSIPWPVQQLIHRPHRRLTVFFESRCHITSRGMIL